MGTVQRNPLLYGLDEQPKNGKEVKQKVVETTTETTEAVNPLLYGLDVKKKGEKQEEPVTETTGEISSTGTENTLPSPSQSSKSPLGITESRFKSKSLFAQPEGETIFDKSFLDRDIERHGEVDLTNPALTKSQNKYSLRNLYTDAAQKRFDEGKELEKINIKSTPESLAAYSKTRLDEINADIQEDTKNLKGYSTIPIQSEADARTVSEAKSKLDASLTEAQLYKNKFKNSIAVQAAKTIIPKSISPDVPFNPKQIGRDIMKVADPDFDLLMQEAETGGASLPGITQSNLEKIGIDLSKDYLQNLPNTPATQQKLKEVEEYEKTFDERNFELTAQRAKEKLGAYFYDKGNSGFWGYSGRNIESAINDPEAGLTDTEKKIALDYVLPTEKKLFFSTDIPGSGFFRSAKNAIEKSAVNTGNTVAGWIGDRSDIERAFDVLNEEVGGSQFRAPGENPNLKSELANLTRKENKEKLSKEEQARKVELEKYVDVRSGWSKFVDGTGDLTGQVAEIALLSKGIGLGGRALTALSEGGGIVSGLTTSALGTALSNETVGLFLSSYLNSYDRYRQQALQIMPGKENAANRDAYAKTMAGMEGLSERLFNDTKILKAFTKNIAPSIADITSRFINKEITQQLAREELQKTLAAKLKPFAKEFSKSIVQESTEEAVVDLADGMAQSIFGGQNFNLVETGKKAVNTFLTTALYSGVIGGMAAKGQVSQNKSQNAFMKSAIVDMANSPTSYLQSVEELRMSGQITQPEANEKIKLIKSASNYLKEIPESITVSKKVDGQNVISEKQLDYPEASSYLIHRMNEGIINEQLENTTDEVLKSQLEQQLKRSIEIRKGIIDNTIGVTPNLEEVAADEKKANDLNVLDANQVPQDELIGTPFIKTHEQIESELSTQLGADKTKQAKSQVKELVDNDLIPETVSPADKRLAAENPLQFLQFVAEQAQSEINFGGKTINNREKATEYFGEGLIAAAEDFFPPKGIPPSMETQGQKEGAAEGVVPSTLKDFSFEREKYNEAFDSISDVENNEPIQSVKEYISSLTGIKDTGGTSSYFNTDKQVGGKEAVIRVSNHPHNPDNTRADRYTVSIVVNGKEKDGITNGDGFTEIRISGSGKTIEDKIFQIKDEFDILNESAKQQSTPTNEGKPKLEYEPFDEKQTDDYKSTSYRIKKDGKEIGEVDFFEHKFYKGQKKGYKVMNIMIDRDKRGSGFGKEVYRHLNEKSIQETGYPLWSPKGTRNENSENLWKSLVKSGEAEVSPDGTYNFKASEANRTAIEAAQPKKTEKAETTQVPKQAEAAVAKPTKPDKAGGKAKKSVLERPIEEVSIEDILKELMGDEGLAFKDVSNKDIKEGDGKDIEAYNQRAERVLKTLYPNAEFKALSTTKEYEQATGRRGEAGVLIRGKDGKHKLFLNLEAIINSDIERTATHEVVHALVSDAIGAKYVDLRKKWDSLLPKLYNVKGFEIVKEHIEKYSSADRPVEGITDLLANIVHDKIKIEDIPKNLWDEFIEFVNKAFEAMGIDYKITADTFNGFASSVKEAFETGDFRNLKKFTAKSKTEKFFKEYPDFAESASAMIDPAKRKQLEDLLRKKVEAELKAGKITTVQAKDIFEKAGIDKPPTKTRENESAGKEDKEIDAINDYEMITSGEVNKFLSGQTLEDVFGEAPEGEQQYEVQKLTEMLQDGKNMIDLAAKKWGMDIMDYGKPLFEHIQQMSNDAQLTNKKAVLLATFLGELKETMLRDPSRRAEIQPLYNAVEGYYQQYMNIRGKEIVAGRLLRLYRDKYVGDIFIQRILDEKLANARKSILEAEQKKKIDDAIAQQDKKITKEEKDAQDKADNKKLKQAKDKQSKKKSISQSEAQKRADDKLKEIKESSGTKANMIDKINEAIKRLNCK